MHALGERVTFWLQSNHFSNLFLIWGENWFCNMTCATLETGVRSRMFSLRLFPLWLQLGPLVLPGLATVLLRVSWLWDNPKSDGVPWPVQRMKAIKAILTAMFPLLLLLHLSLPSQRCSGVYFLKVLLTPAGVMLPNCTFSLVN